MIPPHEMPPPPSLLDRSPKAVRARIEAMEKILERLFVIPGLNKPIGLDVVLDFIPGVGTISAAALGSWIVWEARNLGLSKWQMTRMGGNVGIDMLLGAIPWIGAIPDYFFRSNTRNLRIVRKWLDKHHPSTGIIEGEVVRRETL